MSANTNAPNDWTYTATGTVLWDYEESETITVPIQTEGVQPAANGSYQADVDYMQVTPKIVVTLKVNKMPTLDRNAERYKGLQRGTTFQFHMVDGTIVAGLVKQVSSKRNKGVYSGPINSSNVTVTNSNTYDVSVTVKRTDVLSVLAADGGNGTEGTVN